jgi:hypothetical protein
MQKKDETNDNDWFLEQTIKMSKGYIQPGNYFKNVGTKIIDNIYDKDKKKRLILLYMKHLKK